MTRDFAVVFASLKPVLGKHAKHLSVKADTTDEYTLVTKSRSPSTKGNPYISAVRVAKAYVSFHLMALYTNPALAKTISPALMKRMLGKTCFNFKVHLGPEVLSELERLTEAGFNAFEKREWL